MRKGAAVRAAIGTAAAAACLAGCGSSGNQARGEVTVVERAMSPSHGDTGGDSTACVARFDGIGGTYHRDWSGAHKIAVIDTLLAVQRHLGTKSGSTADALEAGLVADDVDTGHNRLILVADPAVLDLAELRSYAEAAAKKANAARGTRRLPVTVQVAESCFPAAELARVRRELRAAPHLSMSPDVRVDSRVHAGVCSDDPSYAKEVERRYAPMAVVRNACVTAR